MDNELLPQEGLDTISAVQHHLSGIQDAFNMYQLRHFIQKPSEFFALELCGEAGELANLEKKRWRGSTVNHDDIADESADVFIALMNFCNARGVNLTEAITKKLRRIPVGR